MLFGHGGDVYSLAERLGIEPGEVLDFSSNCSPLPYPKGFHEYLCNNIDQLHLLPEVDSKTIRTILANRYNLSPENFLIGNGTTQWIFAIPRLLMPERAFICLPTYADYEDSCRAAGVEVHLAGNFPDGSEQTAQRLVAELLSIDRKSLEGALLFLCNPNNPTGLFIEPDELIEIVRALPPTLTWLIDEAYAPFVDEDEKSSILTRDIPENCIVLRSFSKIYGIPGIRIGCLVSKGAITKALWEELRPWSVNRMAQLAVSFLLNRPDFELSVREYCKNEKKNIVTGLQRINGMTYIPGRCHFALFLLERTGISAENLTEALKERGILIRNCANFKGLSGEHIRISPRLNEENLKLLLETGEILGRQ